MIAGSILLGADEEVCAIIRRELPSLRDADLGPFTTLGVVRRGVLLGGVLYNNYRRFDIQMTIAMLHPGWALPGTIRAMFAYPFKHLGCTRVSAIVGRKNKRSRRLTEGVGFKLEGVVKRGLDGVEDAMIYGMLREDCRWISQREKQ